MLLRLDCHCESRQGETKQSAYFNTKPLFIIFLFFLLSFTPFTNLYSQITQPNPDSIPFAPAVNYAVGDAPYFVFCADLDGDSDKDLAVANIYSDSVSILKNNGDGTFQPKVDYGAGDFPVSVFCADLDGDGDLDLAVANCYSDNVSILKNNGNGTFHLDSNYVAGNCPNSVFCADLDGDGNLDIAVANYGSSGNVDSTVSILKNNGDGTFQTKVDYVTGYYPLSVFCADLDGDADLDLAFANCNSGRVSILKNNGDGTFQTKVEYLLANCPFSVFCADLDGDTDLDLAVANWIGNVYILKNNGDGTFQTKGAYGVGGFPASVFCADLDGDGDLDLAVANANSDSVSILRNLTNNSPRLLLPIEADSVKTPVTFDWQKSILTVPSDTVRYDLYLSRSIVSNPDSAIVYDSLLDTTFTNSLDIGPWYWKVKAYDKWGALRWSDQTWSFYVYKCGDSNGDGKVTVSDVVYDINYLFKGGLPPVPYKAGDVTCDGKETVADVIFKISYLFKLGPPPCHQCP
jgi:hypothetical protein